jgi:hypothetical protein
MKEVLDAVGTAQASLEGVRSIGTTEAPTAISQTTILYQWTMQTGNADRSIRELEILRRGLGEVALLGVATYKKYSPISMKIDNEMSEDAETTSEEIGHEYPAAPHTVPQAARRAQDEVGPPDRHLDKEGKPATPAPTRRRPGTTPRSSWRPRRWRSSPGSADARPGGRLSPWTAGRWPPRDLAWRAAARAVR